VWNLPFRALALRVPTARAAVIPARFPARLVACAAIPALLWGAYEARRIRLNTIAIATHRLPAGARSVRIVQLSDLHLGLFVREAALERILARVREANPDMIAVTGDLLDSSPDNSAPLLPALRALDPPLGKFAVLGNHEFYAGPERCAEFLRAAGFRVLRAERETVKTDGVAVCVAGVDDAEGRRIGAVSRDDERAALTANADRPFTLLLKHQPRITAGVLDRFDLQLSGHTHGGQVFPFQALVRLFYPEAGVLHEVGAGRWLYGSRGAGTWGPPIRLFATPEVTCFAVGPATDGHLRDGGAGKGAGRRGGTAQ
jgi:predicted MPP superfamily phosphohydrolase